MPETSKVRVEWFPQGAKRAARLVVEKGTKKAADFILREANKTVPHDVGDLERSGKVVLHEDGAAIQYDSPYALKQHESRKYKHQGAGRAKWLQLTLQEKAKDTLEIEAKVAREHF